MSNITAFKDTLIARVRDVKEQDGAIFVPEGSQSRKLPLGIGTVVSVGEDFGGGIGIGDEVYANGWIDVDGDVSAIHSSRVLAVRKVKR